MVIIHFKNNEETQFLYNTNSKVSIGELTRAIVSINNARVMLEGLCQVSEQLAKHGPLVLPQERIDTSTNAPTEEQLTDKVSEMTVGPSKGKGKEEEGSDRSVEMGRSGVVSKSADKLLRCVADARAVMNKTQVEAKVCLSKESLDEAENNIKGAVMICYPEGLPDFEPVRMVLERKVELEGDSRKLLYDVDSSCLWWASKELDHSKQLHDYIGKNEKTKILVKLQRAGQGPPVREPPLDATAQKNIMTYYYKKQEEEKRLANDEDSTRYYSAPWADPNSLKKEFTGVGDAKWKPG